MKVNFLQNLVNIKLNSSGVSMTIFHKIKTIFLKISPIAIFRLRNSRRSGIATGDSTAGKRK